MAVLLNATLLPATFATPTAFVTGSGTEPFSETVGDFNGDGNPDLAVANFTANYVSVFLNTTPAEMHPIPTFYFRLFFTPRAACLIPWP